MMAVGRASPTLSMARRPTVLPFRAAGGPRGREGVPSLPVCFLCLALPAPPPRRPFLGHHPASPDPIFPAQFVAAWCSTSCVGNLILYIILHDCIVLHNLSVGVGFRTPNGRCSQDFIGHCKGRPLPAPNVTHQSPVASQLHAARPGDRRMRRCVSSCNGTLQVAVVDDSCPAAAPVPLVRHVWPVAAAGRLSRQGGAVRHALIDPLCRCQRRRRRRWQGRQRRQRWRWRLRRRWWRRPRL